METADDKFYQNLQPVTNIRDIFSPDVFEMVPDKWWVVMTDVTDSTEAIEKGQYKEVNISGALAAIAIANTLHHMEYPFVFGGDGATFLIPGEFKETVKDILADTVRAVKDYYGLHLRAGLVAVKTLRDNNYTLYCAKLRVSNRYDQAFLAGTGLDCVEDWVKCGQDEFAELIDDRHHSEVKADFSGFYCRWKDIKSQRGRTVSLIVKVSDPEIKKQSLIFNQLLTKIGEIFGSENDYRPLAENNLSFTYNLTNLKREALVYSGGIKNVRYYLLLGRMLIDAVVVNMSMRWKIPIKVKGYEVRRFAEHQVTSSDCKKYDGTLKMVISGNTKECEQLTSYLENLKERGEITYGIFSADRAVMTCIVHDSSGREVHFIDTADGGYAMAAKMIKEQSCLLP